jgi:hypothetical protein
MGEGMGERMRRKRGKEELTDGRYPRPDDDTSE